jgi:hypothetical protein
MGSATKVTRDASRAVRRLVLRWSCAPLAAHSPPPPSSLPQAWWRSEEPGSGWQARGGAGSGEGGAVGGGQDSGGPAPHSGKQEKRERGGWATHAARGRNERWRDPHTHGSAAEPRRGRTTPNDVALRVFFLMVEILISFSFVKMCRSNMRISILLSFFLFQKLIGLTR